MLKLREAEDLTEFTLWINGEPELEPRLVRVQVPGLNARLTCASGHSRVLREGNPCLSSHHVLVPILRAGKSGPGYGKVWALRQNATLGFVKSPVFSCVTLDKLLHLSEPQFPHPPN